ncbi:probable serine/threonine-protein kinase kinX [Trichogramma pretiosum]|uniref:probable serine/threonine-protein kinase kinX n=1 Tax=Trichogramma pretiosum TaxID=7493 RepID=UPI000C71AA9F|nr:probable serine/threonine-protein kinase kinX [Trichogramma pretiosum]
MSDKTNSSILDVENMSDEKEDSKVDSKIDWKGEEFQRLIEKLTPEDDDDDNDGDGERESIVRESRNDKEKAGGSSSGESRDDKLESDDEESESKDDNPNCPVASSSSGPGLKPDDKRFETRASEEEKREYYQNKISQIESSADEDDDDQWEDIDDEDNVDMSQHIIDALKYYGLLGSRDDNESKSKDDNPNCPVASGSSEPSLKPDDKRFETQASEEEKREYYQNKISQIESSADEDDDAQWEDINDEDNVDMSQHIIDALKYYGLLGSRDDDESKSKDDTPDCPVASGNSGPVLKPDDKRFETRASEEEKREYYQNKISQIESSADEDDDDQWEDIEDENNVDMSQLIKDAMKYYGSIKRNENDPEEVKRLERLSDFDNPSEEAKHSIATEFCLRDEFSPLREALRLGKKARKNDVKCLKIRKDLIKKGVPEYSLPPKTYLQKKYKKKSKY